METYITVHKILSSDADMHRRLRLSRLFTFLQEAAIAHTEILGAGREKTLDRGYLWVITLQEAHIKRLPVYDETVTLESLPGEMMHAFYPRHYRLLDEAGCEIITADALWALMDKEKRNIVFPDESGVLVEGGSCPWEHVMPSPPPLLKQGKTISYIPPYSYTDLNGHMNNTRYFDLAEDIMSPRKRDSEIREIKCEYRAEAVPGEPFELQTEERDDLFLMSGTGKKKLFRISMKYSL